MSYFSLISQDVLNRSWLPRILWTQCGPSISTFVSQISKIFSKEELSLLTHYLPVSEDNSVVVNVVINRAAFPDSSSLRVVGWETNERFDRKQMTQHKDYFNQKYSLDLNPALAWQISVLFSAARF